MADNKILIIKMSALGDIFMALPHIETIAAHHAADRVTLLTGPEFAELFIHHPRLRVEILDRRVTFGPLGTISRCIWVRQQKFDCIYDLQGNRTSRNLVRFSGSPRRIGTQPKNIYNCHPATPYTRQTRQNVFDRLNDTLVAGGMAAAQPRCHIYYSEQDRLTVKKYLQQNGLAGKSFILLHAGSSSEWPSKQWPVKNFLRLAELFNQQDITSVWVGGPDDHQINEYLSKRIGINATGLFSFMQLSVLAEAAICGVTNDSGPMHIMAAANIPVYSFFGPTSWIRSHAVGQGDRVLRTDVPCSPCFKGHCPEKISPRCLERITVENVYKQINRELSLAKKTSPALARV